jgi:hypothetical protein
MITKITIATILPLIPLASFLMLGQDAYAQNYVLQVRSDSDWSGAIDNGGGGSTTVDGSGNQDFPFN